MADAVRQRVLVAGTNHLASTVDDVLRARGIEVTHDDTDAGSLTAAMFCDDDDVTNLAAALALRAVAPHARLVIRSYNTRMKSQLPELLGDCRVLSSSRLAAPHFCDLAVGAGGPEHGAMRRGRPTRALDRIRGSDGAAICRQLWRRSLFRWSLALMMLLVVAQAMLAAQAHGYGRVEALHTGIAGILTLGFIDTGLIGSPLAVQPAWLQVAAVTSSLFDIVLFTVLLGLVAEALVTERFGRVFGGSTRRFSGHVVIAGVGSVGYRVLRELCERGYRCAVIEADHDAPFLSAARALGAHVTIADVRQEEVFAQLALDRSVAFIALTDDDAVNLEAAFTAADLAPGVPVVVRCFDPGLAARLESLTCVTASRSVARLAAPAFVDVALAGSRD